MLELVEDADRSRSADAIDAVADAYAGTRDEPLSRLAESE